MTDGLWDISIPYYDVYKQTAHTNTHIQPPTHMTIYMEIYMAKEQPSTSKPLQEKRQNSMQQRFCNAGQDLEDIIEANECNYEVDRQLKIDRCKLNIENLAQATIISPSVSVILTKKETK